MSHILLDQKPTPISNIYCIGRNYYAHIQELGNTPTDDVVVFLKPTSSLCTQNTLQLPDFSNDVHHEVELVLYIGKDIPDDQTPTVDCIFGYGVGLDLTARDIQSTLKTKGLPWTLAKGFRNAAWVSPFVAQKPDTHQLFLAVNDTIRQDDNTDKMMYNYQDLLVFLHRHFGLRQGDLIFTGTPSGVGKLCAGDVVTVGLDTQRFVLTVC